MDLNGFAFQIGTGLFAGQLFDLFGGLFLLLVGGAIFHSIASWRFRGLQVDGEIIGVRRRGPYFHGVYRYALPSGELREATSVQSNNSPQYLQTGRRVPIQVMPDKPGEAHPQHAPVLWALASGLLLSGAGLLFMGAMVSKRSPIAWIMIVLAVAFIAYWLWSRSKVLLAKLQPVAAPVPWSAPVERAELLGASAASTLTLSSSRSNPRGKGMLFVILGLGVFALDGWQVRGLLELRHAVRTHGIVVELSEGATGTSRDTFLFPVVQYTGPDGMFIRFLDRGGARPSPFKVGDTVPVLYVPGKLTTATIDRGLSNWEPIAGLAVMGTMLTGLGLVAMRSW